VKKRTAGFRCFECGAKAHHAHHIVPFSRGGTRTVPLCHPCHEKAHGGGLRFSEHSKLTRDGMAKAKAQGIHVGRPRKSIDSAVVFLRWSRGESLSSLAKELGVSRKTLWRRLKEK